MNKDKTNIYLGKPTWVRHNCDFCGGFWATGGMVVEDGRIPSDEEVTSNHTLMFFSDPSVKKEVSICIFCFEKAIKNSLEKNGD